MHIAIRGDAVTVPARGAEGLVGRGGAFQHKPSIPQT